MFLDRLKQTLHFSGSDASFQEHPHVWNVSLVELAQCALRGPTPLQMMDSLGFEAIDRGCKAIRIGRLWIVVDPPMTRFMMEHQADLFPKGTAFDPIRVFYGDTLSTSSGDEWERRFRIFEPGFKRGFRDQDDIIRSNTQIASIAEREILEIKKLQLENPNSYINVQPWMTQITLKVVVDYLFDYPISDKEVTKVTRTIEQQGPLVGLILGSSFLPGEQWRNQILELLRPALCAPLFRLTERIVEHRLQKGFANGEDDLLARLLSAYGVDLATTHTLEQVPKAALEQLKADFTILLIAGYDTTSAMICWALDLLAEPEHQEHMDLVEEELQSYFQGEALTITLLRGWQHLGLIGQEVLRLRTPVVAVPRMAAQTVSYEGITIPRKAMVIAALRYSHMVQWEEPHRFIPGRHLRAHRDDAPHDVVHPQVLFRPFWGKQHRCLGQNLALREFRIVMATLMKHFSGWKLDPNRPTKPNEWGLIHSPHHGPCLRFTARVANS